MTDKMKRILEIFDVRKFLKFSFVGFINTAVFYGIYYLLLQLGFSYVVALSGGTAIGIINSYIWNKLYTFKTKKLSVSETLKFLVVYVVQYLSNLLVIYICIEFIGVSPELAGLPAVGIGVFISYFGHKFWTFH